MEKHTQQAGGNPNKKDALIQANKIANGAMSFLDGIKEKLEKVITLAVIGGAASSVIKEAEALDYECQFDAIINVVHGEMFKEEMEYLKNNLIELKICINALCT